MSRKEAKNRSEEVIKEAAINLVYGDDLRNALGEDKSKAFIWSHATFSTCHGYGTKTYRNLFEKEHIWEEDQGIELPTLTNDTKFIIFKGVHYLCNVYEEMNSKIKNDEEKWRIDAHKDYKKMVEENNPQSFICYLDNFSINPQKLQNHVVNHIFMANMVGGLKEKVFDMAKGDTSLEFIAQLIKSFKAVRAYISTLNPEQKAHLNDKIKNLVSLSDDELNDYAKNYTMYGITTVKLPGTLDDWTFWREEQKPEPKEAVNVGIEHLGCSFRNLPEVISNSPLPWKEFTTNIWDANHQIYGRYQLKDEDQDITVDYKLDSVYFPGKYHFFNKLEIIETSKGKRQQIIIGQAINQEKGEIAEAEAWQNPEKGFEELFHKADFIYPLILAGDIDPNDQKTIAKLTLLAKNKKTKPDVSVVLKDVLELIKIGVLLRKN